MCDWITELLIEHGYSSDMIFDIRRDVVDEIENTCIKAWSKDPEDIEFVLDTAESYKADRENGGNFHPQSKWM